MKTNYPMPKVPTIPKKDPLKHSNRCKSVNAKMSRGYYTGMEPSPKGHGLCSRDQPVGTMAEAGYTNLYKGENGPHDESNLHLQERDVLLVQRQELLCVVQIERIEDDKIWWSVTESTSGKIEEKNNTPRWYKEVWRKSWKVKFEI